MKPAVRITLWTLTGLLLAVIVLLGATLAVLGSQGGSRWLLQQVPGLETQGFQGALLGRWQADRLHWQDEHTSVELQQVQMDMDTACLWRGVLCLQRLHAAQVRLELADTPDQPAEPATDLQLPDVQVPLGIRLQQLELGVLYLNGERLLADLQLSTQLDGSTLQLNELSLAYDDYRARLSGQLQMQGDWPLALTLDAGGAVPELGQQSLQLELGGGLQSAVELKVRLDGVVQGQITGQAQPLLAALPARLSLQLDQLKLSSVLPDGLQIGAVQLQADGSLQQGFAWQLGAQLQAHQQPFELTGQGQADTGSAQVVLLKLAHAEQGFVELQASADWQADVQASAHLNIDQFPWHWLAGLDEAPVTIRDAVLNLAYANDTWQGDIHAALSGPAGDFELAGTLQGDASQAVLEPLRITAGSGRVQGRVQAGWADAVSWQVALDIEQLDPAYWLAELPGRLGGSLHSSGRLADSLQLEAALRLQGQLRNQPLQVVLDAQGQGERWQVPQLELQLGDNRIHGQLQLDQQLQGSLQLALNKPAQLLSGAGGTLQGRLELGGSLQQPDARLTLDGNNLFHDGQRLRQLKLAASLQQGRRGHLELLARGLTSGEDVLGQLQLKADGSLDSHQLQASLQGPLANVRLQLAGVLNADSLHWQGRLQDLQLAAENQRWTLDQPLVIDYLHQQHARLEAHCLNSTHGSLCARGRQQVLPALQLDYQLKAFKLASLAPWLPEGLALDGQLNGHLQVQEQAGGLRGSLALDAGQGALTHDDQRFAWQRLAVDSQLLPDRINSRIHLQGAEQGELQVQLGLDPRPADKPLDGTFTLQGLQLNALHGFVEDIERLQGNIQGQGRIAGTLLQPRIDGDIQLSEGEVGGGLLPVTLETLQLAIHIAGQQARIEGSWRSGEQGQASLQGELDWAQSLQAGIRLKGQALPVFVPPYADLIVAPDLQIGYDAQGLALTGTVAVPSGSIVVKELPPDSVSVSSDAVVVGREPVDNDLQVRMDVTVEVGSERLRFSGFGLTADVAGHLQVTDNLAGRGVLELNKGRFRGYGQKLDLRRARLLFSGPLTQPYIDIEAVRVTGNVTAGLRISGLAEQPQTEVFSEPAMAQEQAMSWLLLGKPIGSSSDGNMMAEAAVAMGLMGALPVTQKLADSLGIRDFELESEGSGNQTSVVASGQITERLSLRYGVGIFKPGSTLGLRYQLTRRLYLDAASGLANSLDLFYRKNF